MNYLASKTLQSYLKILSFMLAALDLRRQKFESVSPGLLVPVRPDGLSNVLDG
jgi:hypothetical protein